MKARTKRAMAAAAGWMALALAWGGWGCRANGGPPEGGGAEPAALDGEYARGESRLRFNGDGRSVEAEVDAGLAAATGLPEGRHGGSYVFRGFHGEWRRDQAEDFRLVLEGKKHQFANCPGEAGEDGVAFRVPESGEIVVFKKTKEGR